MMLRVALPCLLLALPVQATEYVVGVARPLAGGPEIYREHHVFEGESHRIHYIDPDGRRIAEKTLDYRCSDTAPAFEQRDLRDGERSAGAWSAGGYRLEHGQVAVLPRRHHGQREC